MRPDGVRRGSGLAAVREPDSEAVLDSLERGLDTLEPAAVPTGSAWRSRSCCSSGRC